MRLVRTILLALLSTALSAQSLGAGQSRTFRVQGTIKDPNGAVIRGVQIMFESAPATNTSETNDSGRYQLDLPFGVYTMQAHSKGFRVYDRPPFCVTSPTRITFDITLPVGKYVDGVIISMSGEPALRDYYAEESFSLPSRDCRQLSLLFRYVKRTANNGVYSYAGEKDPYDDPVFVAYNLFSLQADRVVYNPKRQTVEASGNVIVIKESGATEHADSITLKVDNGQAIPLP
jgi:hypothetical protein